jgi:hypothetical protein
LRFCLCIVSLIHTYTHNLSLYCLEFGCASNHWWGSFICDRWNEWSTSNWELSNFIRYSLCNYRSVTSIIQWSFIFVALC